MITLAALMVISTPPVVLPEIRSVSHGEMAEALRSCGFQHLTVFYDEALYLDVVLVNDVQADDEQLLCAFRAQDGTDYFLQWDDASLTSRYFAIGEAVARPRAVARAQTYFDQREDLGLLPTRKTGQSDIDYARELERFCGPDAIGFFTDELGSLVVSPDWLFSHNFEEVGPVFQCIFNAITIADLELGFVGNENEQTATGTVSE